MEFYVNRLLYALSYALDCVEGEVFGATTYHCERVAYIAVRIGEKMGLTPDQCSSVAMAAVLHDNALTETLSTVRFHLEQRYPGQDLSEIQKRLHLSGAEISLKDHCEKGEENVRSLPFYPEIQDAILYHHENADGSGAFGLKAAETPLPAQLIHLADQIDVRYDLSEVTQQKHEEIHAFVAAHTGSLFSFETSYAFEQAFPEKTEDHLKNYATRDRIEELLPDVPVSYSRSEIEAIAHLFARIIDAKSHFTCTHSVGIAEKAGRMAEFYHYDEDMQIRLYLAGALHDIGKCSIPNSILEKPGPLTREEFDIMKTHAMYSWEILSRTRGMDDIRDWAALHHEKLDGSGYPFGLSAADLSANDRLMVNLDIYQALIETRPYKNGITHDEAIEIMHNMGRQNLIDDTITDDIDRCFRPDSSF